MLCNVRSLQWAFPTHASPIPPPHTIPAPTHHNQDGWAIIANLGLLVHCIIAYQINLNVWTAMILNLLGCGHVLRYPGLTRSRMLWLLVSTGGLLLAFGIGMVWGFSLCVWRWYNVCMFLRFVAVPCQLPMICWSVYFYDTTSHRMAVTLFLLDACSGGSTGRRGRFICAPTAFQLEVGTTQNAWC